MITDKFTWQIPTAVEYGAGVVNQISEKIKDLNGKHPLLVTDKGLEKTGIVEQVLKSITSAGIEVVKFNNIESNPKMESIHEGVQVLKKNKNDVVIGLGGGSPIDAAKSIAMLAANGGDIMDYEFNYEEGFTKVKKKALPIITIPTTAGTGAEVTFWSIVLNTKKNYKATIGSPLMAPNIALVDPLLTKTMPPYITAVTGVDALSHAIEAYCSQLARPISDALALQSIELIAKNLLRAVANGDDLNARDKMMMGSLLGGMVFGNSDIGAGHCLAHALGGMYNLHHGLLCGIILPHIMDYCLIAAPERFVKIAIAMGEKIENLSERDAAEKAIIAVRRLIKDINLPSLKELKVNLEDFTQISKIAAADPAAVTNIRKFTEDDFKIVLNNAYTLSSH